MVFMLRKAVLPPNGSAGWRSPGIGRRPVTGWLSTTFLRRRRSRTVLGIHVGRLRTDRDSTSLSAMSHAAPCHTSRKASKSPQSTLLTAKICQTNNRPIIVVACRRRILCSGHIGKDAGRLYHVRCTDRSRGPKWLKHSGPWSIRSLVTRSF